MQSALVAPTEPLTRKPRHAGAFAFLAALIHFGGTRVRTKFSARDGRYPCYWRGCREDIHREFDKATTFEERGALLAIFYAMMNIVEKRMIAAEDIDIFRKARDQDYCLLLITESRQGDDVNSELLEKVTKREIDAGRMLPDHNLRQLALIGTRFGIGTTEGLNKSEKAKVKDSLWNRLFGG